MANGKRLFPIAAMAVVLLFMFGIGIVIYAVITGVDVEKGYAYSGCADCRIYINQIANTTDFFDDITHVHMTYNPEKTYEERIQWLSSVAPWMCEVCLHNFALTPEWLRD